MADFAPSNGLLVQLPVAADQALHWWRVADGAIVDAGCDPNVAAAAGEDVGTIIALVPVADAPLYSLDRPDLPVKQAEAVAARQVLARSLGPAHAAASVEGDADMIGTLVTDARLAHGLALLKGQGLTPDYAIPAALVARHIFQASDALAVRVELMGEGQWASAAAVYPAEDTLTTALAPDVAPMLAEPDAVDKALAAVFAAPLCNLLTGKFAPRTGGQVADAKQWRVLIILLIAALVVTLCIGAATYWRFANARDAADARALAAASKVVGPQTDLAAAEGAIDARLVRDGRGAAVMSAQVAALYQAMQGTPQVSMRQLRYTPDGTLLATMAAPTSEAANAVLLHLQNNGYKVTATARTDDSGAQVVDLSIRGY